MDRKTETTPGSDGSLSSNEEPLDLLLTVSLEHNDTRLDSFLNSHLNITRKELENLFKNNFVVMDEQVEKKSRKVFSGEKIQVHLPAKIETKLEARELALDILFEDESLLILNKEGDLSVHPTPGQDVTTLAHGLLAARPAIREVGEAHRPGLVHRLDRQTSGLMVVAKTNQAYHHLVDQFSNQKVHKEYLAYVQGKMEFDENQVELVMGRDSKNRKRMKAMDEGKSSKTFFRVEQRFKKHTLVRCLPSTGRRHQLRVHLSHLGHPIMGDNLYGAKPDDRIPVQRCALHACLLAFAHPLTEEKISMTSPLPEDMQNLHKAIENTV